MAILTSSSAVLAVGRSDCSPSPRACSSAGGLAKFGSLQGFSPASDVNWQDVLASASSCRLSSIRQWKRSRELLGEAVRAWGSAGARRCCLANLRPQEYVTTVKEIADLLEDLMSLKGVVMTEYRAIGPEMRDRVGRLCDRAVVLQQATERAMNSGSRLPSQLTANLRALQREYGSLENIVRLTMDASPALANLEATVGKPSKPSNVAPSVVLEDSKPKAAEAFQSLIRESVVQPLKSVSTYVMSAPESQGSPLAAFRAEIERRVIEQLSGKKLDSTSSSTELSLDSPDTSLQSAPMQPAPANILKPQEQRNIESSARSTNAEATVESIESNLKRVESELARSIPLEVFEQKMQTINLSLAEARAEITKLTAEVLEKEAMVTSVKDNMLAQQELLMQRVRELTGDLEKTISVEDMEAAVNFGLKDVKKALEEEQDRAESLSIELEKMVESIREQKENWRVQREEMEKQLETEHNQTLTLSLELERKQQLMLEQQEEWNVQRTNLKSELKTVVEKFQDVKKKRTKERAQLADKKLKVKMLEQELARVHESMEEADRVRLRKKEAMYATVRMLISQMVLSARARDKSNEYASSLVQEMAKLQEEKQALLLTKRAAEDEVMGIKSNLTEVGREVANLEGELLSKEKTASLEKFFAIMANLIKQESDNIDESMENGYLSDNGHNGVLETSRMES